MEITKKEVERNKKKIIVLKRVKKLLNQKREEKDRAHENIELDQLINNID